MGATDGLIGLARMGDRVDEPPGPEGLAGHTSRRRPLWMVGGDGGSLFFRLGAGFRLGVRGNFDRGTRGSGASRRCSYRRDRLGAGQGVERTKLILQVGPQRGAVGGMQL